MKQWMERNGGKEIFFFRSKSNELQEEYCSAFWVEFWLFVLRFQHPKINIFHSLSFSFFALFHRFFFLLLIQYFVFRIGIHWALLLVPLLCFHNVLNILFIYFSFGLFSHSFASFPISWQSAFFFSWESPRVWVLRFACECIWQQHERKSFSKSNFPAFFFSPSICR